MNRIEEIAARADSVPFVKDRNDIKYLLSALKTAQARAEAAEKERDEWKRVAELGHKSILEIKTAIDGRGPQEKGE